MTSTDVVTEDTLNYLREKNVAELMDYMLRAIVHAKPTNPREFLHALTAEPLPPHVVIAGPPASGKGTQCGRIVEHYARVNGGRRPVHISSGDLLREEVHHDTELGRIAAGYMNSGRLVPDTLIISIVRKRLLREDAVRNGWLLDGFPRNKEQAMALHSIGLSPELFLILEVPDEVLVERVEGRRTDPATGEIYHMKFNPPPASDIALLDRLEQRDDDRREILIPRLQEFHKAVQSLIDYYSPIAERVDANHSVDVVASAVEAVLEKHRMG